MSLSAHIARLNAQLNLRSQFSLCIGNPKARAAIAARLAELSHVRVDVDAADFDSEFGAQRTDAFCDELTNHTDSRDSDYQRGAADYARRNSKETSMSKPTDPQTKMRRNAVVNRYRPPGREPTPKEQERMDAAGREFDAREAFKNQQSRTRAGSVTRLDNNLDNDVDVPFKPGPADEETKKARARAKHRAANSWRVGPLTPAEQRQVDLDRAGREDDGPDAA